VAAVTPADGAQNVDVAVIIGITFDLPAVPESLEVSIDPSVSFAVTWSADARTAYLNPDADLDPDTDYTVTVHDVASTDDGWIEDEYVFSFTTQSSGEGEGEGGNEGEGEGVTEGETEGEPPSSYRQEMRDFVQALSAYAKAQHPGFLIVPQNGEALLTSNGAPGGTPSQDYLNAIDGQGREDVLYGYTADNVPTPAADRNAFIAMLDFAEAQGVEALVTDYCSTHSYMDDSYASNAARGYLSFAADSRELDRIPSYPAAPYQVNALSITNLAQAENMLYLLNAEPFASRAAYLSALDATNYDVFILDLFHDETALTAQEVAGLKTKANGGQRLLLAYMSIGEAEDYRYYWQMAWQPGSPSWLQAENPDWEGNYKVRYWDPGWQAIIFGSGNAYLNRILAAGFDGVYLDIIDAYEYFEEQSGEGEGMPEGEGVEEGQGTEEGEGEGEGEGIAEGEGEGEGEGEPLSSQVTFTTSEQVMVGGYLVNSDTLWRVEAMAGAVPENISAALDSLAVNQDGLDEGPVRVSWDGSWYVFSSERFDTEAAGWAGLAVAAGDLSSVASVRTASGLIHGSQPSITNDGATVVYVGSDGPHDRDIFVTHLEGSVWSTPVALSADSPFATHDRPVLSQTEDKVLFNAGDDFDHLLVCEVNTDGSGFRQAITPANAPAGSQASQIFSPSYAPDGSIVFETAWTGGEQIWRLPVEAGANPVLVGATFNNDNSPVVLPDGRIASLWLGHPDGNNGHHVKIMGANGQNSFMLTLPAIPPNFQDIADFGLGAGLWLGGSGEGEGEHAYYVALTGDDAWDGSMAHPWRTIQYAADHVSAGDTIYVMQGTYNERVDITRSGASYAYLTLAAYPGDTVTVDGTGIEVPEYSGLVNAIGVDWVRIQGLRVQNAGPYPTSTGIQIEDGNQNIVEDNYTYNTLSSGILVWNCTNALVDGNEVVMACNGGRNECITVGGSNNFEVRYNTVHDSGETESGGEGICIKDGSANGLIHHNAIHHVHRVGLYLDAWDKHTHDFEIYNNLVHDVDGADGFAFSSENGGLLENVAFYNNIGYDNGFLGLSVTYYGDPVPSRPMHNIRIVNNTFYNNGVSGWGGGITIDNPDIQNLVVRNNIVSQNLTFQIAVGAGVPLAQLSIDHNLIDGFRDETPEETRGTDYQEGPAGFVNAAAGDFHLTASSPAIDHGSPTNAATVDYDGRTRPRGAGYDLGAFEY
jgi:cysteinyl-tRNA synthetase